jgi:hypothetical protein
MSAFETADTHISRSTGAASQSPIIMSHDDAGEDPAGRRVLYILGLGIAGAIVANGSIFAYFAMYYAAC